MFMFHAENWRLLDQKAFATEELSQERLLTAWLTSPEYSLQAGLSSALAWLGITLLNTGKYLLGWGPQLVMEGRTGAEGVMGCVDWPCSRMELNARIEKGPWACWA